MNISDKVTINHLQELLIYLKEQEENNINTIDIVKLIKQNILNICTSEKDSSTIL